MGNRTKSLSGHFKKPLNKNIFSQHADYMAFIKSHKTFCVGK